MSAADDFSGETPTRQCLMVAGVEVAPEFCEDRNAITAVRQMCWQHGQFSISDSGVRVRLPVENCATCAGGAA